MPWVQVRQADWVAMTERVLKLSLPTLYGWVFLFYCLFHLWLNILAELTLFGDREFYKVCPAPGPCMAFAWTVECHGGGTDWVELLRHLVSG